MDDLERPDLTFQDLCQCQVRIIRSDRQIERHEMLREEFRDQRSDQQTKVDAVRRKIIGLHHRLEQWQSLISSNLDDAMETGDE